MTQSLCTDPSSEKPSTLWRGEYWDRTLLQENTTAPLPCLCTPRWLSPLKTGSCIGCYALSVQPIFLHFNGRKVPKSSQLVLKSG